MVTDTKSTNNITVFDWKQFSGEKLKQQYMVQCQKVLSQSLQNDMWHVFDSRY